MSNQSVHVIKNSCFTLLLILALILLGCSENNRTKIDSELSPTEEVYTELTIESSNKPENENIELEKSNFAPENDEKQTLSEQSSIDVLEEAETNSLEVEIIAEPEEEIVATEDLDIDQELHEMDKILLKALSRSRDICDDIVDLEQRDMCRIAADKGMDIEDIIDLMESMGSINCEILEDDQLRQACKMAVEMEFIDSSYDKDENSTVEAQAGQNSSFPGIKIINYTDYSINDLENWINLAESKMKNRRARILFFIYPVGEMKRPEKPVRSDYADQVFMEHEVLLTQNDIEVILDQVEDWFAGDPCLDSSDIRRNLSDYRSWLENGADASTMHGVCEETRIVAMGVTENMRSYEPLENFQNFLIHELYHAFQQDLEMEGKCQDMRERDPRNSNTRWLMEGAAHYFATWLVAEIHDKTNYLSQILDIAYHSFKRSGEQIYDAEPDKWGAAALSLMVKQNLITEDSILDGSLFHNCDRELVFNKNHPSIQKIKDSWNLIEKVGDAYVFKAEALN